VNPPTHPESAEARFRAVFSHLPSVAAYARRRGSRDPDAVAAEAMTIAWRRLTDIPEDDPRPWLYATARNLVHAEHRVSSRFREVSREEFEQIPGQAQLAPELEALDSVVAAALAALSSTDREALLLVAWEDLTPSLVAASLGITAVAFRFRFHRARRRFEHALAQSNSPAEIGAARMERP
jgi:RNA polymerase sigma factor (sigma-70 family)